MTLTKRLLLFFLSMLAVVLVGFSTALYFIADNYLHQQVHDRLDMVLNTLSGIAEGDSDGVEWKPEYRNVNLNFSVLGDRVEWLLADENGQVVDRSQDGDLKQILPTASPTLRFDPTGSSNSKWKGAGWEFGRRWIRSDVQSSDQLEALRTESKDDDPKYLALSITAGVSLEPVKSTLNRLMGTLTGLSVGIWILALIAGRVVCRHALLPVNRMALAAREIDAAEFANQRLPIIASNDELEALNRAFNNLLDRLQETFERQKRFTGDASHQLRTPLTAILGQIEVALRRERRAEDYRQVLVRVQQKANHLAQMVESLLFLARAESEAQLLTLELMDLTKWLPQQIQTWSSHPRFRDIVVECDPSTTCRINAQPALFGELLNVLLDNACNYSKPGTSIKVQLEVVENTVAVTVEDHGNGIDSCDLSRLFVPFFRSAESRERGIEGTGLGLSIAKRLAEVFDGKIDVSSQLGQGSRFTLRFASVAVPQGNHSEGPRSL